MKSKNPSHSSIDAIKPNRPLAIMLGKAVLLLLLIVGVGACGGAPPDTDFSIEQTRIALSVEQTEWAEERRSQESEAATQEPHDEEPRASAGLAGNWETIDSTDHSYMTLYIEHWSGTDYYIAFLDEQDADCGTDTSGNPTTGMSFDADVSATDNVLVGDADFFCQTDPPHMLGVREFFFFYYRGDDTLRDAHGRVWTRVGADALSHPAAGQWEAIDRDQSYLSLTLEHWGGDAYYVAYWDELASACGTDNSGNAMYAASFDADLSATGDIFAGAADVFCQADPPVLLGVHEFEFTYSSADDTLRDADGIVWTRVGAGHLATPAPTRAPVAGGEPPAPGPTATIGLPTGGGEWGLTQSDLRLVRVIITSRLLCDPWEGCDTGWAPMFTVANVGPDDFHAPLTFVCVGNGTPITPGANCDYASSVEKEGIDIATNLQLDFEHLGMDWLFLDECTYTLVCSINAGGVDPYTGNNAVLVSFP
ncbi:MAG: hypothetical protein PVF70_09255 [Anaerolineales bacterium]